MGGSYGSNTNLTGTQVQLTDHHTSGKYNFLREDEAHVNGSMPRYQRFGEEEKGYSFFLGW